LEKLRGAGVFGRMTDDKGTADAEIFACEVGSSEYRARTAGASAGLPD